MKIELELIEKTVQEINKPDEYKKDGLYLVNDGIAFAIVSVINLHPNSILIANKSIISQFEKKAVTENKDKDIMYKKSISQELDAITEALNDVLDAINSLDKTSSNSNLSEITKLIAVAQDAKNFK